jgi:dCMP deaminase
LCEKTGRGADSGAPVGCNHCIDIGCLRDQLNIPSGERHEICRATHAEQNAIAQAAYSGTSVKNGIMYVTTQPCVLCAKLIINAGISKVIFKGDYPDKLAMELFKEAGVRIVKYEEPQFV